MLRKGFVKNMDNQKIGNFIAELRREKGMTQKELAEKMNVTDKAVSKWERGAGYPEITTIPTLADSLGVSTSELLLGERISIDNQNEDKTENCVKTDIIVSDAIEYAEQAHQYKTVRANKVALTILSITFLIAIFVCTLCNYVISGTFDWSLYVVGSEAVVWLLAFPFFAMKRHRFYASLTVLTVTIIPLLMLIEHLCPAKNWVFPFAFSITAVSLAGLWITALLFAYKRIRRSLWFRASIATFVFGYIVNLSINGIVRHYLPVPVSNISVPIVAFTSAFAAVVLAIIGILKRKAKRAMTIS
jgi:transcriptional regulator with XRE-family HTH domain